MNHQPPMSAQITREDVAYLCARACDSYARAVDLADTLADAGFRVALNPTPVPSRWPGIWVLGVVEDPNASLGQKTWVADIWFRHGGHEPGS